MNELSDLDYYDFKIFLDKDDNSLVFHAQIANRDIYSIIYDLHDLYSTLFMDIKNGDYSIKYINNKEYLSGNTKFKYFSVNGKNSIENLKLFEKSYKEFHSFNISFQKAI